MVLNNEEKKNLEIALAYKGFSEYESPFFDSSTYQELINVLNNLPQNIFIPLDSPDYDAAQILKIGKEIIEKHVSTKNLLIPGINKGLIESLIEQPASASEYNRIINRSMSFKSVTEIPVDFSLGENNSYACPYLPFGSETQDVEQYKKLPIIIDRILISGASTQLGISSYVHEMGHALTYKKDSYTDNLLYDEVISIFLELVTSVDLNNNSFIDIGLLDRIRCIKTALAVKQTYEDADTNPLTVIDCNTYLVSTLLALHLFSIYLTKQLIRKEMDTDLNAIFSGDITLDDMLKKYEATEENGVKTLKKVTSYLGRYK